MARPESPCPHLWAPWGGGGMTELSPWPASVPSALLPKHRHSDQAGVCGELRALGDLGGHRARLWPWPWGLSHRANTQDPWTQESLSHPGPLLHGHGVYLFLSVLLVGVSRGQDLVTPTSRVSSLPQMPCLKAAPQLCHASREARHRTEPWARRPELPSLCPE